MVNPLHPAPAAAPTHTELCGAIGSELAEPLTALYELAQALAKRPMASPSQIDELLAAVEGARKVARQSQQIARLATFKSRQRYEQLGLDEVLTQALGDYAAMLQGHSIGLVQDIKAVDVMVDPGLLTSLLEAALGWAFDSAREVNTVYNQLGVARPDGRIKVVLENKNWPKRAVLFVKVTALDPAYAPQGLAIEAHRLSWYLTAQVAQAMQLKMEKISDGDDDILMLEFSRPLDHPERPRTAAPVGHAPAKPLRRQEASTGDAKHLLLITGDEQLNFKVKKVIWEMGWSHECVSTTLMAMSACYAELPQMVLIDERLRDPLFEEFRQELASRHPQLQFLEIAVHHDAFEMDEGQFSSMKRVHSAQLHSGLVPLLS
ncbi:MAG: hypothetical protein ACKVOO_07440 [Burkholderiaceae bacterium]